MADQIQSSHALLEYVRDVSLRDDPVLRGLRKETAELPMGTAMQVMAEEGQLLALLVTLCGATRVVEIGTFTGYSALCMARALPPHGRLVTCDITDRWAATAAPYWREAGVFDRIELRVGDACATLEQLLTEWGPDSVDLVFVDADKANYPRYYEAALSLTRPGGLVVVDNTLFFGRVIDPGAQDRDTLAVRELNRLLHGDERVDMSLLTMADGITLARKR
ncbi:SAM-dependent methyltransferase [Streptomyces cinnamoneus]|uniref:SAM-dependent methyltransferase n=1 Tax=Streptomyces cinnamoneus TaxID=53446 RepID=A0A2G1XPR2_STRCJ|nr:class I SAM-dependent methyltransferase [Streptomyces cinnamoneus]PHQ53228.1 SAM-dependent methyltransferase [Streptomyces cinnamoneus]PPT12320.1 SAM-dependent methyltransferase [Streptomyces cinnamoneus]